VYKVSFTQGKFILCLKIIKKDDFNEKEYENAQTLIKKKNVNIIDYNNINRVSVGNEEFVALMLEYANEGVLYFLIYFPFIYLL
jgi:N-methylhydantoinase B/oxoprolinase/acetone carboxylase alpha subunit